MPRITVKDGTEIFYMDWGSGQPIVFHHGWPLSADDWDAQMMFFLGEGYRVIAARSPRSWPLDPDRQRQRNGHLRCRCHRTRGGTRSTRCDPRRPFDRRRREVARYVARAEPGRVAKAALISAVPPIMVKSDKNPGGLPIEVFDGFREQLAANRAQFYVDVPTGPFYGFNRAGAKVSQGVIDNWWRQGMNGGIKAHYDCIAAFSETDFTDDLKAIDVPVLVMHGDDDQIVPYADSAPLSAKLLKHATLKTYPGFPHGMCTTHAETINPDLLAFARS